MTTNPNALEILYSCELSLLAGFGDACGDVGCFDFAKGFAVDGHGRGHAAATDAAYDIEMELAIGGSFTLLNIELGFDFVEDIGRAFEVASGAETDGNVVFAGGLKFKVVVEGDDFIDAREGNSRHAGEFHSEFAWDVAVFVLNGVEHHNKIALFAFPFFHEFSDILASASACAGFF
jgi:hypothetical protein